MLSRCVAVIVVPHQWWPWLVRAIVVYVSSQLPAVSGSVFWWR